MGIIVNIYIPQILIKALNGHNLLLPWSFVYKFTCLTEGLPIIQLVLTLRLVTYTFTTKYTIGRVHTWERRGRRYCMQCLPAYNDDQT